MIGDANEDIGKPGLRIDVVELGGLDQGVDDGGALAAAVGATEQPCLAAERDAAERALGGIVGEADAAIVDEARERVPALEHVEAGLGQIMAARQLADLLGEPGVELGHERRAEFLAGGDPLGGALAVHAALDVEQGIETLHGFERDRIDHGGALSAALLAGRAYDIGELEELAARMGEAARLEHGAGIAALAIELAISAIGIGLQDAGPCRELGLRVLAASVTRVVEQRGWWIGPGKGTIIAHVDP